MSLDGKIATHTGDSRWISSEESREYVHKIRGQVDGIMVGINTVQRDDPLLTCRIKGGRNPRRIIIDSNAAIPLNSRLINTIQESELFVAVGCNAPQGHIEKLRQLGCKIISAGNVNGLVDMKMLFQQLGKMNLTNVLVEGGSRVITSIIEERLADKLMVFIAPIIVGGEDALSSVMGAGITHISESTKLTDITTKRFANDLVIEGVL